jgi:hypothetical protein
VGSDQAIVTGILRKGYGVASGPSPDYPYGALERQIPIFRSRGLDLSRYYQGTLNIDIQPFTFTIIRPDFTFLDVCWTDLHPPEHFSFVRCMVGHADVQNEGWVYYPHPETKRRNFQDPSLLEVIAHRIPDVAPGDALKVCLDPGQITLERGRAG